MLKPDQDADALARFATFDDVVALVRSRKDMQLLVEIENYLRLANYSPGHIEFEPTEDAPTSLASRISKRLQNWTGARWLVSVVSTGGAETIANIRDARRYDLLAQAQAHPMVFKVLEVFPGAEISNVRSIEHEVSDNEAIVPIDPDDVDEDWDPIDPFSE